MQIKHIRNAQKQKSDLFNSFIQYDIKYALLLEITAAPQTHANVANVRITITRGKEPRIMWKVQRIIQSEIQPLSLVINQDSLKQK